jgi:hypothetical protein
VDDEPENSDFTAAWKILRVNAFYRSVLGLRDGDGVITKKDYKRELEADSDSAPEIYTRQELDMMFGVMDCSDGLCRNGKDCFRRFGSTRDRHSRSDAGRDANLYSH